MLYKVAALASFFVIASHTFGAAGVDAYLQGLDHMEAGKFADAAAAFEKAIDQDDENADFRIALGAALTLAERLPDAEKALSRAIKLSNNADEARLWMATAVAMQGDFQRGTQFYPFAIARNEYVNTLRRMSHEYGQAAFAVATAERNGNNEWDVEYAKQQLANRDKLRPGFIRFGAAFSQKMKAKLPAGTVRPKPNAAPDQQVSAALMERIKANIHKPDYPAALRDINPLLAGNPKDPQLLVYHGLCTLHLGAPEIARQRFTQALYSWPLEAELYAMRAVAAARTGDLRRAKQDVQTAQSLGSRRIEWAQSEIGRVSTIDGEPAAKLTAMFEAAQAGARHDVLVEQATTVILTQNAVRRRLDEDYVDRVREHQQAVNGNPQDAAAIAAFAAFLYDNAIYARGEAVELRAAWRPYRQADEAMIQAELSRALKLADDALAIDGANVSAMITKAAVLVHRLQLADADQFLKKALAIAPTESRLLRLFAEVADRAAAAKQAQASALRTPTTWEDSLYIYTRYPSAAERAQADALEAQANQLWTLAREALGKAIRDAKNPADVAFFQAILQRRDGNLQAALTAAQRAAELDPSHLEYLDLVTTLLASRGQKVEALLNQAKATNLLHSTAGPALKCVWFSLPRTKFKTSREYLAIAGQYDAADPRIAAYYGAIAAADERNDIAAAWYAVACAMYEATARFEGVSADSREPAPLRADVAATMMNVNLRAIALLRAARPVDAKLLAQRNLAMESRLDPSILFTPVPESMLPDVDADQIPVPQADHPGYMLSVSQLELGRILILEKRYDDAITALTNVASYRERVPPTVDAGSKMQYPIAEANVWIVSALIEKGDMAQARERFRYIGRPREMDPDAQAELKRISDLLGRAQADATRQAEEEAIRDQQQRMDEAMRERQRQIEEAERRRGRRPTR